MWVILNIIRSIDNTQGDGMLWSKIFSSKLESAKESEIYIGIKKAGVSYIVWIEEGFNITITKLRREQKKEEN